MKDSCNEVHFYGQQIYASNISAWEWTWTVDTLGSPTHVPKWIKLNPEPRNSPGS